MTYQNPILDEDFPDPSILRAPDGFYYAYATQTKRRGQILNFQVARSANLIAWEHLGEALPDKPAWARAGQRFWAPHVVLHEDIYYFYYWGRLKVWYKTQSAEARRDSTWPSATKCNWISTGWSLTPKFRSTRRFTFCKRTFIACKTATLPAVSA